MSYLLVAHGTRKPEEVLRTLPAGPPVTVAVLAQRLIECGWRPGDSVVLGAAGTSDANALSDLRQTAATLSALIGDRVELAYAATGAPRVADPLGDHPGLVRLIANRFKRARLPLPA